MKCKDIWCRYEDGRLCGKYGIEMVAVWNPVGVLLDWNIWYLRGASKAQAPRALVYNAFGIFEKR